MPFDFVLRNYFLRSVFHLTEFCFFVFFFFKYALKIETFLHGVE